MKKGACLNSEVSYVISGMGHFDQLAIGDAGFPVPKGVPKIDLAVTYGTPEFLKVLDTVSGEFMIQKAVIAAEMKAYNPDLYHQTVERLKREGAEIEELSHEELKQLSRGCKAVIRTGECTPYANVILESKVSF